MRCHPLIFVVLAGLLLSSSCRENGTLGSIPAVDTHAPATIDPAAKIIAPLIDPAKLATLKGDRAANRRLRIAVYWLEDGGRRGGDMASIIQNAQTLAQYVETPRAALDEASLLRNRIILERLGCLDEAGMDMLRQGKAPTITKGPYAGEIASVDHIIPRSVVPELDNALFNLEFMPVSLNQKKSNLIGARQKSLAQQWNDLGLLSDGGLQAVLAQQ